MEKHSVLDSMIGTSSIMREVTELIRAVSPSSVNVLISGESGTGKELVARALHQLSPRKQKPFVAINCSAIPDNLLESELFGHVKGSFTGAISDKKGLFEEAEGGTLFLDEIGDLNLTLQVKLLRVLQDKEVRAVGGNRGKQIDARIISASHRDLKTLTREGKFREDLFYRLNVVPIKVPPLRERTEDIPLLVEHFTGNYCSTNNSPPFHFPLDVMNRLLNYSWPGNVRELENVIERLCVLRNHDELEQLVLKESTTTDNETLVKEGGLANDRPTLEKLEERYIKTILNEVQNKKSKAAQVLGISRRTLHRKELAYRISSSTAIGH